MLVCMTASAQTDYRKGEVIVKFKNGAGVVTASSNKAGARGEKPSVNSKVVNNALLKFGVSEVSQLMPLTSNPQDRANARGNDQGKAPMTDLSQLCLLKFDESKGSVEDVIKALKRLEEVEYAEPNRIVYLATTDADTYQSEPRYGEQWGLQAIRMPELWAQPVIHTKRPIIAILDTGVDTEHPDLKANLLPGYNAADESSDVTDNNGHGTHCAGIAAGVGSNNIGITGANSNALILPIKIVDSEGFIWMDAIIKGVDYAIAQGADIISMSFGGARDNLNEDSEYEVMKTASNSAILVAAAGNNNMCMQQSHSPIHTQADSPQPFFPAAYDCVIGVQSTDQMGRRSSFSNYDCDGPLYSDFDKGFNYDLKAPGSAILSTYMNHVYRTLDGTSMACPLVAGAISRLLQCKNFDSRKQLVKTLIETSGDCIDMMAAYQYTEDKLNAETFTADCNGVTVTFHKTSSSTVEVGNGSDAAIPTTIGELIIPETAHGYLVTGIAANAFNGCAQLLSVSLPYSITKIGSAAFDGCTSLTNLQMMSMPWSVVPECANNAFSETQYTNCKLEVREEHVTACQNDDVWGLFTSIQKPEYALGETFKETIDGVEQVFRVTDTSKKTVEIAGYVSKLENPQAILTKADSVTVRIPEEVRGFTVTKIADNAFSWNVEMEYLVIPETVTEIGGGAFYCCWGLRSLHIPASVVYINKDITQRGIIKCPNVQSVSTAANLGYEISDDDNIVALSFGTFWNMASLESVSVAEGNPNYSSQTGTIIENSTKTLLVGCKGAVIPNGTKYIGPNAFSHQDIGSIVVPEGVVRIDDYAFYNAHLKEIVLPNSLKEIGANGLAYNLYLKAIDLSGGVESLGHNAIGSSITWRTITIPANVKMIDEYAFSNNKNLRYVVAEYQNPTAIPLNVFDYVTLSGEDPYPFDHFYDYAVLYVPEGCKTAYENTAGWNQFKNIVEICDIIQGDVDGNGVIEEMDRQVMEAYLIRYKGVYFPFDLSESDLSVVKKYLTDYLAGNELPDVRDLAADLNNDGEIDLCDYVILTNLLEGKSYDATAPDPTGALTIDKHILPQGVHEDITVRLKGKSDITAMIFEIRLPQDELYLDVTNDMNESILLSERLSKTHTLKVMNEGWGEGACRFILLSKNNAAINALSEQQEDELFRIHVVDRNSDINKLSEVSVKAFMVATSGKVTEDDSNWEVKPQLVFAPGQQWQTFYSNNNRILESGKGAKTYTIDDIKSDYVIAEEIAQGIPAYEMVLVGLDKVPTETTYVNLAYGGMDYYYVNTQLYGNFENVQTFEPYETCILNNNEFAPNAETSVPAGTGFIFPTNKGKVLSIVIGGASMPGDVNGDGAVNGYDADAVVRFIVTRKTEHFIFKNADVDNNNRIDAADLVIIINMIPAQQ